MKFLGIDYGEKRVGLAVSSENGILAFPKELLLNNENLLAKVQSFVKQEQVSEIVIGDSLDLSGEPNALTPKIDEFANTLEKSLQIPVHKEKEFLTTVEARRYAKEGEKVDASAAALILQRYLDRINNKK